MFAIAEMIFAVIGVTVTTFCVLYGLFCHLPMIRQWKREDEADAAAMAREGAQ